MKTTPITFKDILNRNEKLPSLTRRQRQSLLVTEAIRQSKWSHKLFCLLVVLSACVAVTGEFLLIVSHQETGGITSALSLGVGTICAQLATDSKSKLVDLAKYT